MSFGVVLAVLAAAILHASWNALLRAGADRLWSMTIMCIAVATVCGILAIWCPIPARASWPYAIASAVVHIGYNLLLVATYRHGDLGQTYPIARGSSPLLVSLCAALFAAEWPTPMSLLGVLLVSGGIISLAFQGRSLGRKVLPYALGTGCTIGIYSVIDGIGARMSGAPVSYTIWMCLLWGLLMPPVYVALRDWRSLATADPRQVLLAASGGIVSLIAYGIVIFAMSVSPMGPVSALRETSVVFAALIGRFFLKERLTWHRLAACIVVAVGAACLGAQVR
jgi:drug/metabolite transporter (DMT)-like permease